MTASTRCRLALLAAALLAGCTGDEYTLPGTLEWDRIALPAEQSESILRLAVREGDAVRAGQLLAQLDPRRADARVAHAQAQVNLAQARLDEARHGARAEALDGARARYAQALAGEREAQQNHARIATLVSRAMASPAALDQALATRDGARAASRAAAAQLRELVTGTRVEQVVQAEATLAAAQALLRELQVSRARLRLRAPRAGRVDALPFKVGDQPPAGATVVSLLVGPAPYARVYVPAPRRAGLAPGARFTVQVQGVVHRFPATVRSIAREASFTPYYALSGDDASRLVYRAELVLSGQEAGDLAAGLTVQAVPDAPAR